MANLDQINLSDGTESDYDGDIGCRPELPELVFGVDLDSFANAVEGADKKEVLFGSEAPVAEVRDKVYTT